MKNRYLDYKMKMSRDRAMDNELQERYRAKREEIARHRDYMHKLQMSMQPYRRLRQEDGTEYEYQSAFELPREDYARRGSNQYETKYDRESYAKYGHDRPYGYDSARGIGSSNMYRRDYEPYGESYYYPPLAPQDYAYRYRDYDSEKNWHKDLEQWIEKLKKKDRFHIKKEDVISSAKQMNIKFDEFSEDEFYAVYLMMISDYKTISNDFRTYINMAREWLEDDDIEVNPSEKLCIYMYEIVKGESIK